MRADVDAALAHAPLTFLDCGLDGADLSRLELRHCSFSGCSIAETSFPAARLGQTAWQRCRGRQADLEAADLTDARFQGCDLNNSSWRHAHLASAAFKGYKLTGADFEDVARLGMHIENMAGPACAKKGRRGQVQHGIDVFAPQRRPAFLPGRPMQGQGE